MKFSLSLKEKAFEDNAFGGDVKYHLGYSGDVETYDGKKVHISLTPNPSHLEAVDALVQGIVRSKLMHRVEQQMILHLY